MDLTRLVGPDTTLTPDKHGNIPTLIPGWNATIPNVRTTGRMLTAYTAALHDNHTVEEFLALVRRSLVCTSRAGFALFDQVSPACLELHGARWDEGKEEVEAMPDLLRCVLDTFGASVVLAPIPEWNKPAIERALRWGFEPCGLLPLYRFWNNKPANILLHAFWR